jgi:hypothetical protein
MTALFELSIPQPLATSLALNLSAGGPRERSGPHEGYCVDRHLELVTDHLLDLTDGDSQFRDSGLCFSVVLDSSARDPYQPPISLFLPPASSAVS